jgi:hypothetical protein
MWAGLNEESRLLTELFDGQCMEVKGSDSPEYKALTFEAFQDGEFNILVTKARIGGFGMNFQNAHNMMFFGLNDSWETWYQCIRRQWRYLQTEPVNVHVVLSNVEAPIYQNVMRKDAQATRLRRGLIQQIKIFEKERG